MCDDVAFFQLPNAFRRVCVPHVEPIDPPTTNLQDYVRRIRVTASRPGLRPEGTPVALAVLSVTADSVFMAAIARGKPRTIDVAMVPVDAPQERPIILSLLATSTPGLMTGELPPNSLWPNTEYQFTVSATFQYGTETPRIYVPRDVRGHPIVKRLWTHGAPMVISSVGRMVQVQPPQFNRRRPAWYVRNEPGAQGIVAELGRGPQTETMQLFVEFASTVPGTQRAMVGPIDGNVAFAPSNLPAGIEYDASEVRAVYAFNGVTVPATDIYTSARFSVIF